MKWFRQSTLEPLAVTMSGVKLGDRLLVVGGSDARLIAALANKAGLTGRACAVDASDTQIAATARAVERDGVLIEPFTAPWTQLPFDPDSFDIVVIRNVLGSIDEESRRQSVGEAVRVLRPGGRCMVIDDLPATGLRALVQRGTANAGYASNGEAAKSLEAGGFRSVRTLAEREGMRFVEGIKRSSPGAGEPVAGEPVK